MNNTTSHKTAYEQRKLLSNIWNQSVPVVLFQNKRILSLYFVFFIALLTSIFISYFTLTMSNEWLLQEFSSLLTGRLVQFAFLILGNILLVAVFWLRHKYILAVYLLPDQKIKIKTWDFINSRIQFYNVKDFSASQYIEGITNIPNKPSVNAPYIKLRLHSGKTLILDMQGDFPSGYAALDEVLLS